jgi:hypothetical protein
MAWISNVNNTITKGSEFLFLLKDTLVSASWTVISSSNGSVLSAGDIITSASVLETDNSYFLVQQPTGSYGNVQRILGFQSAGSTGIQGRGIYIHTSGAGDLGGTATAMPSGSNEEFKWFAADRTSTIQWATNASNRAHFRAENTAPYAFWAAAYPAGGGNSTSLFIFDPMVSGTFSAQDNDPYVLHTGQGGGGQVGILDGNYYSMAQAASSSYYFYAPKCWFGKGLAGEAWAPVGLGYYAWVNTNTPWYSYQIGTSAVTNYDTLLPGFWAAPANHGFKGVSTLVRLNTNNRSTGSTISTTSGALDWIAINHILLPWNGVAPSV